MTVSLDKKEQWLNQAIAQMREVDGIDTALHRLKILSSNIERIEEKTTENKIDLITFQKGIRTVTEIRESLIKQAYDNLRLYFNDHPDMMVFNNEIITNPENGL